MFEYDKSTKTYQVDNSKQADVAWVAGFFEGEGSITIYHTSIGFLGNVSIEQRVREPLDKVLSLFGGKITPRHASGYGKSNNWQWQIYGHQAKAFLGIMLPFIQSHFRRTEIAIYRAYFSTTDFQERTKYLMWWRHRRAAAETERKGAEEKASAKQQSEPPSNRAEVYNSTR